MDQTISKPYPNEYAAYYSTYISQVKTEDLISELEKGRDSFIHFVKAIPSDKLDYRYQKGKWSIRELILHMIDTERIFAYRALRFSRNDQTLLPGFDENEFAEASEAGSRSMESLINEYTAVRQSTIEFFKNISSDMSLRTGIANGKEMSVRAVGYVIVGHEAHHIIIIKERYL